MRSSGIAVFGFQAVCNNYIRQLKIVLTLAMVACCPNATSAAEPESAAQILLNMMADKARGLAAANYAPPVSNLPSELADMSYSRYRAINFKPEQALWRNESLFEVQFFHPGFLYKEPVDIKVIDGQGLNARVDFNPESFNYNGPAKDILNVAKPDFGFAGFRIHYPLNSSQYKDEFVVFQGASYFRLVGPGHVYGMSARGLAIDTAGPNGEEFPVFREFWLLKPQPESAVVSVFALLDSPSVAGAYHFEFHPGVPTSVDVDARLFARTDVGKLGVAPLTSMFHYGENRTMFFDDFRPEVHDSDGLQMLTQSGEWIWRPLTNPTHLSISSLLDENPQGFGLMQRDREFGNYHDVEANYHRRPSFWVKPLSEWGKGRVELVEIPSQSETNDNIVAYWVPEQPLRKGEEARFRYSLTSLDAFPAGHSLAHVASTRIGWAAIPGQDKPPPTSERQFVVDFTGADLDRLAADIPLEASLSVSSGQTRDLHVVRLPAGNGWRVSFKLTPEKQDAVDMRLYLSWGTQRLSEVWNYVWYPNAVR